jgi:hypothetical protein
VRRLELSFMLAASCDASGINMLPGHIDTKSIIRHGSKVNTKSINSPD